MIYSYTILFYTFMAGKVIFDQKILMMFSKMARLKRFGRLYPPLRARKDNELADRDTTST